MSGWQHEGIDLMKDHMNITFVDRSTPNFVPDESEILDGDFLAIFGPSNVTASESLAKASLISLGTHSLHFFHFLSFLSFLFIDIQLSVATREKIKIDEDFLRLKKS
jgi:hypothetical protein